MNQYKKFMDEMTDEKAIEYMYQNGYVDLKIADYIAKRINQGRDDECYECAGVAGMELPLSTGIKKVNYCPMCGRKF